MKTIKGNFIFDKEENKEKIDEFKKFIEKNKDRKGPLMPILQEGQNVFGYLPEEILKLISSKLNIPLAEIYGVATFYSQFTFIPKGKTDIHICLGTACYVKGGADILEEFEKRLNIKKGETTEDRKFSISETRCLGDCGKAPVVEINGKQLAHFTKEDVKKVLEKYK
ncbi:NADH-quinone oxidoreductase subunit NuoE [Anaerococcus porci]|uniref:NADH-quinone oxidoreductase subunit NuoE n=1 Tax=Anaerococcus porci TaxID=2652269 RepID=A0A6N7VHD6_9FIRM|nr:NADH-quinone oxidoreductase subunit NuoE [Anaerococcus porci]MDY3005641.1 NADH-quinone oxidoreductase subunit NuoE [Anaerococcus porci]MSS78301.1 NADH-quinone oxidoreductase subunit NuoE [Anaerococcus porci]